MTIARRHQCRIDLPDVVKRLTAQQCSAGSQQTLLTPVLTAKETLTNVDLT